MGGEHAAASGGELEANWPELGRDSRGSEGLQGVLVGGGGERQGEEARGKARVNGVMRTGRDGRGETGGDGEWVTAAVGGPPCCRGGVSSGEEREEEQTEDEGG